MIKNILIIALTLISNYTFSQSSILRGSVTDNDDNPIAFATVLISKPAKGVKTDSLGGFHIANLHNGEYMMHVTATGYLPYHQKVMITDSLSVHIVLNTAQNDLNEVVVSGTMKEVLRSESPVPVEVYTSKFFKANPTASIFDALQNINGVRPQLNCNVCNTGDIHINGLEGPYTMVLIDGMPIVSGLSTVYGLSGIPQSLVDRVEIVKGPASTLYGSEAVGGLINIITKSPDKANKLAADVFGTTWGELNADISTKLHVGNTAQSLLGVNYFNYQNPVDHNKDGFTDVTLQNRFSIFNKWNFNRRGNRIFSVAARYVYEDRWGGEMRWNKQYRGGKEVYGESIYTKRWEVFGNYQLPFKDKVMFMFSANGHNQNSAYGNVLYLADQRILFGQFTWNKQIKKHDVLMGLTYRYTYYDDNTPAMVMGATRHTNLPGLFIQDEYRINSQHTLLAGVRYDYHSIHGNIFTPRINYKWNSKDKNNVLRISAGNGYRVANVFTEDHAALTGAREVVFKDTLKPETSWNGNLNFVKKIYLNNDTFIGLDGTVFYTYFTNKIVADYDTNPNEIIYGNLNGHAVSKGVSLNIDVVFPIGLKMLLGATAMDVYSQIEGSKKRQMFAERFTGVWNVGYTFKPLDLSIDYTGNLYSPMRLPLLGATDPRRAYSPWWSIQNIQLTKTFRGGIEIYGGVKNLLNWTPNKGNPFLIARSHDPFDNQVKFDANGAVIPSADNSYGLTFDPNYMYAPNQGIRAFLGMRYYLK